MNKIITEIKTVVDDIFENSSFLSKEDILEDITSFLNTDEHNNEIVAEICFSDNSKALVKYVDKGFDFYFEMSFKKDKISKKFNSISECVEYFKS